jgi:hypothetical protein
MKTKTFLTHALFIALDIVIVILSEFYFSRYNCYHTEYVISHG